MTNLSEWPVVVISWMAMKVGLFLLALIHGVISDTFKDSEPERHVRYLLHSLRLPDREAGWPVQDGRGLRLNASQFFLGCLESPAGVWIFQGAGWLQMCGRSLEPNATGWNPVNKGKSLWKICHKIVKYAFPCIGHQHITMYYSLLDKRGKGLFHQNSGALDCFAVSFSSTG